MPVILPRSIALACSPFRAVNTRPPGNEIITLVKDTSLAFAIGVGEMFSTAKALVASQVSMVPFAIAALIYWVFNFVVEMLLGAAEKKLDYYHD